MALQLSHGLPRLSVAGSRIVEAERGQPVLLRGVNLSGLEYCSPESPGPLEKAHIGDRVLDEVTQSWNANIIRLPFNQSWALKKNGYDPGAYLAAIETVIGKAAQRSAYSLVDLQWLDAGRARGTVHHKRNFIAPLPDAESVVLWQQLARRWSGETAILYDIFSEPHHPLPDDPEPLLGIREDGSTYVLPSRKITAELWRSWALQLITAIREHNPDALIFVSGINWGYDLRECILKDVPNIVYSTHVYPSKGKSWDRAFGNMAGSVPVFAAEWGGTGRDLPWGLRLAKYFDERGMGWTAWSWSDEPRLVTYPPSAPFPATRFGEAVRDLLRSGLT